MTEVLTPQKYLRGLMDKTQVAEALGVSKGTIGGWLSRKEAGLPGIHQSFPDPIGMIGGANVWDEDLINAFGLEYSKLTPAEKASSITRSVWVL